MRAGHGTAMEGADPGVGTQSLSQGAAVFDPASTLKRVLAAFAPRCCPIGANLSDGPPWYHSIRGA